MALIRDQAEVLEFCVRSVYEALSPSAKEVLAALSVLGRSVTADELVLLLDCSADSVNVGLQELIRGSLVRRDSSSTLGELALRVRLTETATQFINKRVAVDRSLAVLVAARDIEYRTNEERRLADTATRSLAPIVVRTNGPQDIPTAQLLRRALLASQAGKYDLAFVDIETAHRLNPELWEVDRVEAFILAAAGDFARALVSYETAYAKAEGEGRAVVSHFMAGHFARNLRNLPLAIQYAREAHEALKSDETAVQLGNYLVWNRDFEPGIKLIEPASLALDGKAKLIAVSSLAEAYRRWAEDARAQERNPVLQCRRALRGLGIALASLEAGVSDRKLRDIAANCAATALGGAAGAAADSIALPDLAATTDRLAKSLVRLVETPSWARLRAAADRLARIDGVPAATLRLSKKMAEIDATAGGGNAVDDQIELIGEVVAVKDLYGFIRHPAFPNNIFFHRDDIDIDQDMVGLNTGALVSFMPCEGSRGPRAAAVKRQT